MPIKTLDVRNYDIEDKPRAVFDAFDSLDVGEKMLLIDNHDPNQLYNDTGDEMEREFEWKYIEEGPELWKVAVEKRYRNFI